MLQFYACERLGRRHLLRILCILNDPPAAQKPEPTSAYDLTSIMATVRKMLRKINGTAAQKPLTRRDAWSATFEHVFSLDEPSNQGPQHLPACSVNGKLPTAEERRARATREAAQPVTGLQYEMLRGHSRALFGHDRDDAYRHVKTEGQVSAVAQDLFRRHKHKTLGWKQSKGDTTYTVGMLPDNYAFLIKSKSWLFQVNRTRQSERGTLSCLFDGQRWCLDGGALKAGETMRVSHCYPSADPMRNRDKSQNFIIRSNAEIGPAADPSLCMTTFLASSTWPHLNVTMLLMPCNNSATQRFAYHGGVGPGGRSHDHDGTIFFGDDTNSLVVFKNKL